MNTEHYDNIAALSKPITAPQYGLGVGSPRRMGMVKKKPLKVEKKQPQFERREEPSLLFQAKREADNIKIVRVEYRRSRAIPNQMNTT